MARYRKKQVVILVEAEQFGEAKKPWPRGVSLYRNDRGTSCYILETHEALMRIRIGDWVVTDANGDRAAWSPCVFEATYEPF